MTLKGRRVNGRAVLALDQVEAIRMAYSGGGVSQRVLADQFGVTQSNISHIVRHVSWMVLILLLLAGCAATPPKSNVPPHIVPRIERPGFQILSVREHRVDMQEGPPGQIRKLYAIDVMEHGQLWRIVINRDNETVGKWKLSGP